MNRLPSVALVSLLMMLPNMGKGEVTSVDDAKPLEEGQIISSEKYDATFTGAGFTIKARDGGQTWTVRSLPPVYTAKWTNDSSVLATVEHIAGGTDGVLFHQVEQQWIRSDTTPSEGLYDSYKVAKWNVGQSSVDITYKVALADDTQPTLPSSGLPTKDVAVNFKPAVLSGLNAGVKNGVYAYMWTPNASGLSQFNSYVNSHPATNAPIVKNGTLAVDTDGCGSSHGDPDQQHTTSAKLDSNHKLVPRYLTNGHSNPAGQEEVNADDISYGVAPKNLAKVNGGPLEVGDKLEVTGPAGTHATEIGDFGPPGKNGEISYHAIKEFGYKIVEPTKYGPLPSTNGTSTEDVTVTVKYFPQ